MVRRENCCDFEGCTESAAVKCPQGWTRLVDCTRSIDWVLCPRHASFIHSLINGGAIALPEELTIRARIAERQR
jgi:hypothetical protein